MTETIRPTTQADAQAIARLHLAAFGEEGPEIVALIDDLLADASARPLLSLAAMREERLVGHVLFSAVRFQPPRPDVAAALLAPLAVHPDCQSQGIGDRLVREGLTRLAEAGVEKVFVLGHPDYYPRFGFQPAGVRGYAAPYPIPEQNAAAWRLLDLRPGAATPWRGTVICADALADPKYWRE